MILYMWQQYIPGWREAERLQNMAQLAALGQDIGRATGRRKEEEQAEACRVM